MSSIIVSTLKRKEFFKEEQTHCDASVFPFPPTVQQMKSVYPGYDRCHHAVVM